jgi:hypothetical protein
MAMNENRHSTLPSILAVVGLVLVYLGERVLEVGKPSTAVMILGVLLVLAAFVVRLVQSRTATGASRAAQKWLAIFTGVGALALLFYFVNSSLTFQLTGHTLEERWPRLSGVLSVLWPSLLFCAAFPVLFIEMSLATMKRAPVLDLNRVRAAMLSALGLGFALIFCFAVAYVASERDAKIDFSYFRTARAGEATKKLVRALDKPVRIYLFFPPGNETREEVESYFADLTRESKQLIVEQYDIALHPAKARELGVTGNGIIVVSRDSLREQIPVPLSLEAARQQLKVLDQEVHKRLLTVSRPGRVAYFTHGHEERLVDPVGDTDQRSTVRGLKDMLVDQGFQPKDLGLAEGLGTEVPNDASIVLIVGPRKNFMKEETAALLRYLDRKGRLLIALDPDGGVNMEDLLGPLALKYNPVTLADDKFFVNRTYQRADRINIATGAFSSHVSVSTIGKFGIRAPVIMFGAGHLSKFDKGAVGIVNVDFTVHSQPSTWDDVNGNFEFDSGKEVRASYELVAAVNKRNASALAPEDEARAVVLADSDALSDLVIGRSIGNSYLARDAIRWLGGEESISGTITTEEDVPVTHTRKQDTVWFYSSTLAAPAIILALGLVMTRRRRSNRAPAVPSGTTTAAPPIDNPPASQVSP